MSNSFPKQITYPVYIIENQRQKYNNANIVRRQTGFITLGRVPAKRKFVKGHLFDSRGICYEYQGECGWPRYGGRFREIAELLILPALISKVLEVFLYFGPDLKEETPLSLDQFKAKIVQSTARIAKKDLDQLKRTLASKTDYISVIEGVEWWLYNAGKRDQDGHPV